MFKFSNKHKYTLQRINALLLGFLYSLISIFLKKKDYIVLTSSLNNEFSDNSRALFEALYASPEFRDKLFFVLNNPEKRKYYNEIFPNRFITNNNLHDLNIILRAKTWCASSLEFPAPGYFNKHLRMVYHLGHGMPYKKAGLMETSVSWYKRAYYKLVTSNISYSWATSPFFTQKIATIYGLNIKQVIQLPQPKSGQVTSPLVIKNNILNNSTLTHILYAPTWRPYGDTELFPFPDRDLSALSLFLQENKTHIWLRLHPRFEHNIPHEILELPNIHLFSARDYSEINLFLAYFDALITDYSSIYFDFLLLERPVLFFDYDKDIYNEKIGIIDDYQAIKSTQSTDDQITFSKQIKEINNGTFDLSGEVTVNNIVNYKVDSNKINNLIIEKLFQKNKL